MNVLNAISHWPKVTITFSQQYTANVDGEVTNAWAVTGSVQGWKYTSSSNQIDQAGKFQIIELHNFVFDPSLVVSDATITTGEIATIAFPSATTITDSGNGFLTAGFYKGQQISITTDSGTNDGTAIITGVTAGTITCSASSFTIETAGTVGDATIVNSFNMDANLKVVYEGIDYFIESKDNIIGNDQVQVLIGRRAAA